MAILSRFMKARRFAKDVRMSVCASWRMPVGRLQAQSVPQRSPHVGKHRGEDQSDHADDEGAIVAGQRALARHKKEVPTRVADSQVSRPMRHLRE
jgi:hypothetical protein